LKTQLLQKIKSQSKSALQSTTLQINNNNNNNYTDSILQHLLSPNNVLNVTSSPRNNNNNNNNNNSKNFRNNNNNSNQYNKFENKHEQIITNSPYTSTYKTLNHSNQHHAKKNILQKNNIQFKTKLQNNNLVNNNNQINNESFYTIQPTENIIFNIFTDNNNEDFTQIDLNNKNNNNNNSKMHDILSTINIKKLLQKNPQISLLIYEKIKEENFHLADMELQHAAKNDLIYSSDSIDDVMLSGQKNQNFVIQNSSYNDNNFNNNIDKFNNDNNVVGFFIDNNDE
jgi:hypothetical protein